MRGELARLLREAGGSELRIDGAVRLELLPVPRVVIERAVIGDRIEFGPGTRFLADRIDIDLAPLGLLAGRIEPVAVQLVRPELALAKPLGEVVDSSLRALSGGPFADVRRIDIVDGSVSLAVLDGAAPLGATAVDLAAVRDGASVIRLDGSAAVAGEPLRFTLTGEPLAADRPVDLTLRIETGSRDSAAVLEFTGVVAPTPAGLAAAGRLRLNNENGPLPRWLAPAMDLRGKLEAQLDATTQRLALTDLSARLAGRSATRRRCRRACRKTHGRSRARGHRVYCHAGIARGPATARRRHRCTPRP